jgi:hypothetical protein
VALLLHALFEVGKPRAPWGRLAALILSAFGALRFETGFDWMPYATAFDDAPTLVAALQEGLPDTNPPMEPLYLWLMIGVKTLTDNVSVLFGLATLFGIGTIHAVTGRISRTQAMVASAS